MTKDDLRKKLEEAALPKPFPYSVEAWDGLEVHLIPMNPDDVVDLAELFQDEDLRPINVIIATVIEHLVSPDGEHLFDYDDEGDREILRSFDAAGYRDAFDTIQERALGNPEKIAESIKDAKAKVSRVRKRRR